MKIGGMGQLMEIVSSHGGAEVQEAPPQAYMNVDKRVIEGYLLWSKD